MYREIGRCRLCGNEYLDGLISLGHQCLTGIFPRAKSEHVDSGPLELVKCSEKHNKMACGLVQLKHSYMVDVLYGDNYGYRSSLNSSMVKHLNDIALGCVKLVELCEGDLILDIGSNDGTLLSSFPDKNFKLVGIDPTAIKFREYYPQKAEIIPEFFSALSVEKLVGKKQKAKVITSIAMFYDLEEPQGFVEQVYEILDQRGVWVFEQSYLPSMLVANSYDTICHEHLEYYGLKQIKWILDRAGLKIVDLEFNNVNGGSFKVTAAKKVSPLPESTEVIMRAVIAEEAMQLSEMAPYMQFREHVTRHREQLPAVLGKISSSGCRVLGYGASTKGNVILQYCGITQADIPFIADVNTEKFGAFTPGTLIPIISESQARDMAPDYYLVLPWHFRDNIIVREKLFIQSGGKFIFPLPQIEVVGAKS